MAQHPIRSPIIRMPGHVGTIARVKRGVCSDDETKGSQVVYKWRRAGKAGIHMVVGSL